MRLATINTTAGPRLHVRGRHGYVDLAEAAGNPRLASVRSFLEDGAAAWDAAREAATGEGREFEPGRLRPGGS